MEAAQPIPTSLKVVAALFILGGISSLIDIIVSLLYGHVTFNFGVLGVFIGAGLLQLKPAWRRWALVFTWIGMVGAPLFGLIFLIVPGPLNFMMFGQPAGHIAKAAGVAVAVAVFLVSLWQYRVLTRPDVRALFRRPACPAVADRDAHEGLSESSGSADGPSSLPMASAYLKEHFWCMVVMLAFVVLLGQTALRLWLRNSELESELERVYANEVVIQAIDAETKEAVPVTLQLAGKRANERWPDCTISRTDTSSEVRVRWIDVRPLPVVVSSDGHSEQTLSLDRESNKRIVVPLNKSTPGGG